MIKGLRAAYRLFAGAAAILCFGCVLALSVKAAEARTVSQPMATKLEAAAAMFVIDRFLDAENDIAAIAAFYGDSVFYFREGAQTRAEVLADKKAYLERWPQRRFDPDLSTLRTRLIKGPGSRNDVEVKLEVDFEVGGEPAASRRSRAVRGFTDDRLNSAAYRNRNTRRVSRGRSLVVMVLAPRGDEFMVISEGGQVIQRR